MGKRTGGNSVKVHVTVHALERWQQRAAIHGDEKEQDVIDAFERSIDCGCPSTMHPKKGQRYRFHAKSGCTFVCQAEHRMMVIITVVPPTVPVPPEWKIVAENPLTSATPPITDDPEVLQGWLHAQINKLKKMSKGRTISFELQKAVLKRIEELRMIQERNNTALSKQIAAKKEANRRKNWKRLLNKMQGAKS
jgi:hypothetical protein